MQYASSALRLLEQVFSWYISVQNFNLAIRDFNESNQNIMAFMNSIRIEINTHTNTSYYTSTPIIINSMSVFSLPWSH